MLTRVYKEVKGYPELDHFIYTDTGETYCPKFQYSCKEQYESDNLKWVVPMTAKEIETPEAEEEFFKRPDYYIEEKFDGTRATLHMFKTHCRVFSRRISDVTGWFSENTDSLPQLRDLAIPSLDGTILDGEMFVPNKPFKVVSSIMNCKWDKAIDRQQELGFVVLHAFDITHYKGKCIEQMPLWRRKQYLRVVVNIINQQCPYVKMVEYYTDLAPICLSANDLFRLGKESDKYFHLYAETDSEHAVEDSVNHLFYHKVSKQAYYEYIVFKGGEGVILKDPKGKYYHKRGREYQKIKKFLTRECIILGFLPPTKEYNGKFPKDQWSYWVDSEDNRLDFSGNHSASQLLKEGCIPVSKYWYEEWVGNIRYGVIITDEEIANLDKKKKFNIDFSCINEKTFKVIEVGDCSGFNEEMREYFTKYQLKLVDTVVEVKANELFTDTGKMRHPRFLRLRSDKSALECTWKDHISAD